MITKIVDKIHLYKVIIQYKIYNLQIKLNKIPLDCCYTQKCYAPFGYLEKEGLYEDGEISPIIGLLHDIKMIDGYNTIYLPEYETSILFINDKTYPLLVNGEIIGIRNGKLSTKILSKEYGATMFGNAVNILKMTPKFKIRNVRNYAWKIPMMLFIIL